MYFQNPPTNFIDKFVLIINPLQMNVNFFLGHQCKTLRLTSNEPNFHQYIPANKNWAYLTVRRKILRLYFLPTAV